MPSPPQATILLVDDNPANLLSLEAVLAPLGQRVLSVSSGEEALRAVLREELAVILLDVQLRGMDGLETARLIKQREKSRRLPIIFLTAGSHDEERIARGYQEGAVDFLLKPFHPDILRSKVQVFVELWLQGEQLKRQQEALHRQEREATEAALRRVLELAPMGLLFSDLEGRIHQANDAFLQLVGHSRTALEAGAVRWDALTPPGWEEATARAVAQLRETGSATPFEKEYLRPDGTRVPVLVGSAQVPERGLNLTYVLDRRAQKAAEQERAELLARAQAAHAHAEAQRAHLHGLFMQARIPICLTRGPAHLLELANPHYLELLPDPGVTVVGRPMAEVFEGAGWDGGLSLLACAFASGEPCFGNETRVPLRNGRERFFNFICQPMRGVDGTIEGVMVLANEVTEQVQARARVEQLAASLREQKDALEESELRYRSLLDLLPQPVWAMRPDGTVFLRNQAWRTYAGVSDADGLAAESSALVHPEDRERMLGTWADALSCGTPFELEYRLRRHDGVYRWFLCRVRPEHDARGQLVRWIASASDIDDQRRARDTQGFLAEASAALSSSLEVEDTAQALARLAVPRLADWCNLDLLEEGQVRKVAFAHADAALEQQLRPMVLDRRTPVDRSYGPPHVIRTGRAEAYFRVDEEALSTVPDPEVREAARRLGLSSYLCVPLTSRGHTRGALTLLRTATRPPFGEEDLVLAQELAHRAALALDNALLYAEAQRAIRLRDEFLSVASHELRTPLTPLQLKLAALQREAEAVPHQGVSAERLKGHVEVAQRQVRRLADLIQDLLDVSRIDGGRMELAREEVDLVATVQDVVSGLQPQAARAHAPIQVQAGPQPLTGSWDRLQVEQVITNLLTNAIKYGAGKPIAVAVRPEGEWAHLEVRDHGIGIPPEAMARIFGRFERAVSERHYGGLGLGLYITRQLVEAHGGRIEVESAPGRGSTFRVALPRRAQPD